MTIEKKQNVLVEYIKNRINKQNKNFFMIFVGATGSGKSYSALRLAELLDPTFDITRCYFKAKDFMNKINELTESGDNVSGKVVLWDEFGVEHNAREFMSISNRVINYFFQTSRHLNLIVFMTVPYLSFVDSATRKLTHCVGELVGMNSKTRRTAVKIKMLQSATWTSKIYPKYLRYSKDGQQYKLTKMLFKHPSKELARLYEIEKKKFTSGLNKGIMNALVDVDVKRTKGSGNSPTARQEEVMELLKKNGVKAVSKELGVQEVSIYAVINACKKKGFTFEKIKYNNIVKGFNIERN